MKYLFEALPMLRSPRFWAIVACAAVVIAYGQALIDEYTLVALLSLFGAPAVVKTIDRHGEKKK